MTNISNVSASLAAINLSGKKKKEKEEPPDSWDAASLSSDDDDDDDNGNIKTSPRLKGLSPVPSFDKDHDDQPITMNLPSLSCSPVPSKYTTPPHPAPLSPATRDERPATTDAVARRMISAALGVRVRSTKEQREFDKALREREKKKLSEDRQRRREEEIKADEAKKKVWDD